MRSSKGILLVCQSSGYLVVDVANAFLKDYENVVLLVGLLSDENNRISNKVKISKICKYNKKSLFSRFFSWVIASLQISLKVIFKYRSYDILYFTNPPMSYFVSLFAKNRFSIVIYDLYPNALQEIGIGNKNIIYRIWSYINKKVFKKAHKIYSLSEGMSNLLTSYVLEDKIKIVPLWPSCGFEKIDKSCNKFLKENNLENKFIVMYSGNIGLTHNVEVIIELANRMRNVDNLAFIIIGDGARKKELQLIVNREGLSEKCLFYDFLPFSEIKYSLSAADISIVTLSDKASGVSVPSKTFNILAIGSPLLCIASNSSELYKIVSKYDCGVCYDKSQIDKMVEFISKLMSDRDLKIKLSANAISASMNFTSENAKKYLS